MPHIHNPQWYDAAPAAGLAETEPLIAALPANRWVEVPQAPRPCPERSWGVALYDPGRDQMYFWTGGHCADPADIVYHFHPGLNRWCSITFSPVLETRRNVLWAPSDYKAMFVIKLDPKSLELLEAPPM